LIGPRRVVVGHGQPFPTAATTISTLDEAGKIALGPEMSRRSGDLSGARDSFRSIGTPYDQLPALLKSSAPRFDTRN
jgi:hypothetical protein